MITQLLHKGTMCEIGTLFLFRAAGGQIKSDGEYRLFEGGKYDEKGFLIKSFPIHAVVSR